ncbi:ATP F0F1 synthase subunit B [Luteithermobacter gelatinilyticus]|uniref:F0F1 ATP synthase subunit B family protein n=1 Tax=Luteithermobacter gelatinilyticus TaxID=2582913 RepID=UPI001106D2F7|nr:ATP F0F1 synthase subunit B [Luteithermobacter gelatinilyticus]
MVDIEQSAKELEEKLHQEMESVATAFHEEETHQGYEIGDATFWVAVSAILFVLLLIRLKVPGLIARKLDERSAAIEEQLNNARQLREEASALLNSYQRDQRKAEQQAKDMLEQAESEAKALAEEAEIKINEMVERRTRLAEQKIAQAEANAVKEIQQIAADAAIAAARQLIAENLKKADKDALIKASIENLDHRLH